MRKKMSRCEHESRVESARGYLAKARAIRLLTIWRNKTSERQQVRGNWLMAEHHGNSSLLKRTIASWRNKVMLRRRKKLLEKKWEWFKNNRLLVHSYSEWRIKV